MKSRAVDGRYTGCLERMVDVTVYGVDGGILCNKSLPHQSTLRDLKTAISPLLPRHVSSSDMFLMGPDLLEDDGSKIFSDIQDDCIDVTLVFGEGLAVNDTVYYTGTTVLERPVLVRLECGQLCKIRSSAGRDGCVIVTSLDVRSHKFRVHIGHLKAFANQVPERELPGGYSIGDDVYYIGPPLMVASAPTNFHLSRRMRGQILARGVLPTTLRIRFDHPSAPAELAINVDNVSREYPGQRSCSAGRCFLM